MDSHQSRNTGVDHAFSEEDVAMLIYKVAADCIKKISNIEPTYEQKRGMIS